MANIWKISGRRCSLLILKNLTSVEIIHFNELKLLVSGISSTLLAGRLSELEREELVNKKYIPPRVRWSHLRS
jgi:DNA-binding HxlR family transcriptional regulator